MSTSNSNSPFLIISVDTCSLSLNHIAAYTNTNKPTRVTSIKRLTYKRMPCENKQSAHLPPHICPIHQLSGWMAVGIDEGNKVWLYELHIYNCVHVWCPLCLLYHCSFDLRHTASCVVALLLPFLNSRVIILISVPTWFQF